MRRSHLYVQHICMRTIGSRVGTYTEMGAYSGGYSTCSLFTLKLRTTAALALAKRFLDSEL